MGKGESLSQEEEGKKRSGGPLSKKEAGTRHGPPWGVF